MAKPGKRNPFLSGFLLGLFVGLALAVTVAVLVTRDNPFVAKAPLQQAGGTTTGTPAIPPAEAPKYEFYQALPEGQTGSAPAAPAPAGTIYFLQAGAYGNAADADQVKARLALLGFEAQILLPTQNGGPTLYRIRIGPFKSLDELNIARARLTQSGMETILVKISPQQEKQ
jgi:cell division protein FtsN